jgi:hypothetical protein
MQDRILETIILASIDRVDKSIENKAYDCANFWLEIFHQDYLKHKEEMEKGDLITFTVIYCQYKNKIQNYILNKDI